VSVVFQNLHLISSLTVLQNLLLAQKFAGQKTCVDTCQKILASLGLADKAQSYPYNLSLGQAQRVAIARAIVQKPAYIIADEPTSALDDENATQILTVLKREAAQIGAGLVVATHDARIKNQFQHKIEL
jgi:putative ABC transport system ATP-binding protein